MNQLHKPLHIIGISTITSNDVAHHDLSALWELFSKTPLKQQIGATVSPSIFSVYSDYENGVKGKYKVTIGYAVNDVSQIPAGLSTITIPQGNYKTYPAKSHNPEDIVAAWKTIWAADHKELPRNFKANYEEYNDHEVTIKIGHD